MTSNSPLVSIVIPAYNQAEYLKDAIDSVLAQTYAHVELIVIDDGSTDATREVLEDYRGRFRWERQPNIGQALTLTRGWQMAAGEVLAYLSADDVLLPEAVEVSVEHLTADPCTVMVYCDNQLIDQASRVIRTLRTPDLPYVEWLVRYICAPAVGAFFRRDAYERAGPWNPELRRAADFEFWLRLGEQGRFSHIDRVLGLHRVHSASASFTPTLYAEADEPIRLISRHLARTTRSPAVAKRTAEAMSSAHVMSSRAHLRAARYRTGAMRMWTALRLHPRTAVDPRTWRVLLNGVINRPAHRLLQAWRVTSGHLRSAFSATSRRKA